MSTNATPIVLTAPSEAWQVIPGTDGTPDREEHRRFNGILSLYVGPAGKRGPNGAYRSGFDHRWTIWAYGTLLGEGFTDDARAARSACEQEADRVEWRIRDAIKLMDVRNDRCLCACGHVKVGHVSGAGVCTVDGCDCMSHRR